MVLAAGSAHAQTAPDPTGLLFRASADKGLIAERAGGEAEPNFQSNVGDRADRQVGRGDPVGR